MDDETAIACALLLDGKFSSVDGTMWLCFVPTDPDLWPYVGYSDTKAGAARRFIACMQNRRPYRGNHDRARG